MAKNVFRFRWSKVEEAWIDTWPEAAGRCYDLEEYNLDPHASDVIYGEVEMPGHSGTPEWFACCGIDEGFHSQPDFFFMDHGTHRWLPVPKHAKFSEEK